MSNMAMPSAARRDLLYIPLFAAFLVQLGLRATLDGKTLLNVPSAKFYRISRLSGKPALNLKFA